MKCNKLVSNNIQYTHIHIFISTHYQAGPRGVLACRCDMLKFWRDMLRDMLKKLRHATFN